MLPLKKGTQYEVVRKLRCQDVLVLLKTSPQAKKKSPQLPNTVETRLLTRTINGKERLVLASMVDPIRFPGADIVELYSHRWEIELGYREMKHSLQQHRLTLRSKKATGIRQELWGWAAGLEPAAQPDGEDGCEFEGIHDKSAEFSHSVGLSHP